MEKLLSFFADLRTLAVVLINQLAEYQEAEEIREREAALKLLERWEKNEGSIF